MPRTFASRMPKHAPHQKHGTPKRSDTYGFLASLTGDACADVNLRWFWNDPRHHDKEHGGQAFGLHGDTPANNGYGHIMAGDRCRPMTRAELHRRNWSAAAVRRWRKGKTARSAAPRTYGQLLAFVAKHGGNIVGELKSPAFATHWIMEQLVATARKHDQPAFYKLLINMRNARGKTAATIDAGGQAAIIFGVHRSLAKHPPADWDQWEHHPSAIWGPANWPLR